MQVGRVLPQTHRLNPLREPAQPASRTRVVEAGHAAVVAVPNGAATAAKTQCIHRLYYSATTS